LEEASYIIQTYGLNSVFIQTAKVNQLSVQISARAVNAAANSIEIVRHNEAIGGISHNEMVITDLNKKYSGEGN